MIAEKFRVIFDCNILWRAFFSRGSGYSCKRLINTATVDHFISPDTVKELTDVLTREGTLRQFPQYSVLDATDFVKEIVSKSTFVNKVECFVSLNRDTKDEPYLNLAIAVDADYLVTTDRDMLDLMTGIDLESKQFRQRFRRLKIIHPDEFLRQMSEIDLSLRP